jgi:hypothetical protein
MVEILICKTRHPLIATCMPELKQVGNSSGAINHSYCFLSSQQVGCVTAYAVVYCPVCRQRKLHLQLLGQQLGPGNLVHPLTAML